MAAQRITAKTRIVQLKIQLVGIKPPIWQRIRVPGDVNLANLHHIIQSAMGWTDSHLHEFEIGADRQGLPDPDWGADVSDESRAKLFRLVGEGDRLNYTYDFGDGWEHGIEVEKVLAPEPGTLYPTCATGRRACPLEDVGGPWGYPEFLDSINDPAHPDHDERVEWIGGDFDAEAFDLGDINAALAHYRWVPLRP